MCQISSCALNKIQRWNKKSLTFYYTISKDNDWIEKKNTKTLITKKICYSKNQPKMQFYQNFQPIASSMASTIFWNLTSLSTKPSPPSLECTNLSATVTSNFPVVSGVAAISKLTSSPNSCLSCCPRVLALGAYPHPPQYSTCTFNALSIDEELIHFLWYKLTPASTGL